MRVSSKLAARMLWALLILTMIGVALLFALERYGIGGASEALRLRTRAIATLSTTCLTQLPKCVGEAFRGAVSRNPPQEFGRKRRTCQTSCTQHLTRC